MLSPRNCSKHCQRRRRNYGIPIFLRYTSVYRIKTLEKSHVIGAIVPFVKDFDGHGKNGNLVLGRWVTTDQRGALDESWSTRSCAEAGVEEAR